MPVDAELLEILACPNCKTPVTSSRTAGPQVRPVPPGVSDQGRHPGDADRRGDHRQGVVRILLVRLRLIGDVVFTTPLLARSGGTTRRSHHLRRRARGRADRRGNPHLNEIIIVPDRRGMARLADDMALARRLRARALRRRDRSARRSAQRVAHVGQRRADAHRLHDRRAGPGCTPTRSTIAEAAAAPLGAQSVGPARAAWASRRWIRRATRGDGGESAASSERRCGSRRQSRIDRERCARRHSRQRRAPLRAGPRNHSSSLVTELVRQAIEQAIHPHVRTIGRRRRAANR